MTKLKDRSYYVNHKIALKLNILHWAVVISAMEDEYRNLPDSHMSKGTVLIIKRELEKQYADYFDVLHS